MELPIDANTVMTHAEVASTDGYGIFDDDPDVRGDLLRLPWHGDSGGGDVVRHYALTQYKTMEKSENVKK